MKILIADDDTISRRLTQKALELACYEVLEVENGERDLCRETLAGPDSPTTCASGLVDAFEVRLTSSK